MSNHETRYPQHSTKAHPESRFTYSVAHAETEGPGLSLNGVPDRGVGPRWGWSEPLMPINSLRALTMGLEVVEWGMGNIWNFFPHAHLWLCWVTLCSIIQAILSPLPPFPGRLGHQESTHVTQTTKTGVTDHLLHRGSGLEFVMEPQKWHQFGQ